MQGFLTSGSVLKKCPDLDAAALPVEQSQQRHRLINKYTDSERKRTIWEFNNFVNFQKKTKQK